MAKDGIDLVGPKMPKEVRTKRELKKKERKEKIMYLHMANETLVSTRIKRRLKEVETRADNMYISSTIIWYIVEKVHKMEGAPVVKEIRLNKLNCYEN